MSKILAASLGLLLVSTASARTPTLSVEAISKAFAARGIMVGAGTMIEGHTWVIEKLRVEVRGGSIILTITPRQMQ